jgi:hypothetical protein
MELAQRILKGETPSSDEMRAAVDQMRGNRTVQAAASASGATRGTKKKTTKDVDTILSNLGF